MPAAQVAQLVAQSRSAPRRELVTQVANTLGKLEVRRMSQYAPGDCFFVALEMASEALTGSEVTRQQLRSLLSRVLPAYVLGWQHYRDLEPAGVPRARTLEELQAHVMQPVHWANDQTLLMFSQLFAVNWVVLFKSAACATDLRQCAVTSIGTRPTGADTYIILLYDADNHYDLVQRAVDKQCVFSAATLPPWLWRKYMSTWVDNTLPPVEPVLHRARPGEVAE
jgi:hypothetical protein